jgi:hypothetical protein
MFKIVILFIFQIVLLSCAVELPEETSYTETSTGEPNDYVYLNNSCEEIINEELDKTPSVKLFINGIYQTVKMEKVENEHVIKNLLLGGKITDGTRRRGKLVIDQRPQTFKYCFDHEMLKENHFEDAALSILDPINKFENRYKVLLTENKISKVTIRALPLYTRVKSKTRGNKKEINRAKLINNAFYSPQRGEITFLPQGTNEIGFVPFGGIPLWKQPMVALHEYGHHFFRSILGGSIVKDKHELCIDNRSTLDLVSGNRHRDNLVSTYRKVNKEKVISALNEGFADIFSYYSNVDNKNLKNFGCMEKSRDVESQTFIQGDTKRLTREAIDLFMSTEKHKVSACILETNYQSVHMIGAIYAFAINNVLKETEASNLQKLRLILKWIETIKHLHKISKTPEELLDMATTSFYRLFQAEFPDKKDLCQMFFVSFPEANYSCQ